jgi:hypothetical protein
MLLKQENLVVEGKSVEAKHGNGQDRATADRIAQTVKSWSIQARAAEPHLPEDMILGDLMLLAAAQACSAVSWLSMVSRNWPPTSINSS